VRDVPSITCHLRSGRQYVIIVIGLMKGIRSHTNFASVAPQCGSGLAWW